MTAGVLVAVGGVVALTAIGFADGWWWPNAHNGLLAVALVVVGAYVLHERPGHAAGKGFVATGALHAVMFTGRQLGHDAVSTLGRWAAWVGVWPIAISIGAVTLCVLVFPDGRLPSPRWRVVAIGVAAVAAACSLLSALWPVEYEGAHVTASPPFELPGRSAADAVWSTVAYPAYFGFQLLWVIALVQRHRASRGAVRRQVLWLAAAAAVAIAALAVGLLAWRSPRAGVLAAVLLPVTAGWSIVHGHHASVRRALSWVSRSQQTDGDLVAGLCEVAAHSLGAPSAELWIGSGDELSVIGRWPDDGEYGDATALVALTGDAQRHVRPVTRRDTVIGALSVTRPRGEALSRSEDALFDDLAAQAGLVVDNLSLARVIERERAAGHLDKLTPRENEVLELMARGRSNAAICEELHLSIKTVEPIISTIFMKLGLHADATSNRRVLAVLAYPRQ